MGKNSILAIIYISCLYANAQEIITINPAITYQTIEGWGHGGGVLGGVNGPFNMLNAAIAEPLNYQYLDYLVDELGLTGSRITEVGPRTDGTGMDNGDCDVIDWTKFQSNSLPAGEAALLVYYKNKIVANGYQPSFYSSTGYPTNATSHKPWVLNHPGERAQQIWANAVYLRDTYGININYDVIYNEPSGEVTATILADDIKALGPRLISHGLTTKTQFAEAIAPQNDWSFITAIPVEDPMWAFVGRLSYHNYGTADPYRSDIRDFALSKGITTAQTEMGNPGFDDLYNDLTLGGVSYWEVGYSANVTLVPSSGLTGFTPSAYYIRLRQVIHYIRPGATRIDITSADSLLHLLAFSKNGVVTTIIDNTNATATAITLNGLPTGTYGISRSQPSTTTFQELGLQTVDGSGTLSLTVNGGSWITTVYPYTGANHAPDIMTFNAAQGYLVFPASATTLTATASDTELNPLTYQWSVTNAPAGTTPVFGTPNALTTIVSALNIVGNYTFNIAVSDGTNVTNKKIFLVVYNSEPQPVLGGAGFRIASPYGLVFGNQGEVTHANIELPTSSATLQIGISDLQNSDFTGRGTWTLVSQPAGANATVGATTYIYVSIRAQVSNMLVPGDYVFRVNVTNPGFPDLTAQIICTVHPQSLAPVINSITTSPLTITLPSSTTLLTAATSDPEGDLLRHWWVVTSVPVGANPVFDHQGLAVTNVSGLTVAGTYTFTLRCFDDLHMATRNVQVVVNNALGLADATSLDSVKLFPNPTTDILNIALPQSTQLNGIDVYNSIGQLVLSVPNESAIAKIHVSGLPSGNYFIKMNTSNGIINGRFVRD